MKFITKKFWKATSERVISSIAGGALAVIGAGQFGVLDADWQTIGSIALGAGVVSLLKAFAAQSTTKTGPGFTNAEKLN
ncbi:holin [Paramicrobacterium agarici]|uniref:holin n=1 Tax=Paramicrobacterium agarici TaxID=630514 RepID=UPI001152C09C|nr:holin [Microbacterium agarici]TQO23774.1 phage r1t holin [Microbacterium agarici]